MNANRIVRAAAGLLLVVATAAWAQAPAGATAQCKDGTYFSGKTRRGACAGHGGIKEWYGEKGATAAAAKPASESKPEKRAEQKQKREKRAEHKPEKSAAPVAAAPAPAPAAKAPATPALPAAAPAPARAPARGAAAPSGSDQVWVNKETKVFHCVGDRWYGKTKNGEYMSRAAAEAQGMRPAKGKYCAQ